MQHLLDARSARSFGRVQDLHPPPATALTPCRPVDVRDRRQILLIVLALICRRFIVRNLDDARRRFQAGRPDELVAALEAEGKR